MTTKKTAGISFIIVLMSALLLVWAWRTISAEFNGLIILSPGNGAPPSSSKALENINMANIMFTYESRQKKTITLGGANYSAQLIGTNYVYPYCMGYGTSGFFTQDEMDKNVKKAVLNEAAAFNILGGTDIAGIHLSISGEEYTVAGVIYDNDSENNNIYIPAGLIQANPDIIIAPVDDDGGISKEFILNELKSAGVSDNNYNIASLDEIAQFFLAKAELCAYVFASAMLMALAVHIKTKLGGNITQIRQLFIYEYASGVFTRNKMLLAKTLLYSLLACIGAVVFLQLILEIWSLAMAWDSAATAIENIPAIFLEKSGYELNKIDWLTTLSLTVSSATSLVAAISLKPSGTM